MEAETYRETYHELARLEHATKAGVYARHGMRRKAESHAHRAAYHAYHASFGMILGRRSKNVAESPETPETSESEDESEGEASRRRRSGRSARSEPSARSAASWKAPESVPFSAYVESPLGATGSAHRLSRYALAPLAARGADGAAGAAGADGATCRYAKSKGKGGKWACVLGEGAATSTDKARCAYSDGECRLAPRACAYVEPAPNTAKRSRGRCALASGGVEHDARCMYNQGSGRCNLAEKPKRGGRARTGGASEPRVAAARACTWTAPSGATKLQGRRGRCRLARNGDVVDAPPHKCYYDLTSGRCNVNRAAPRPGAERVRELRGEGARGSGEEEEEDEGRRQVREIASLVRYPRDGDAEAVRSWQELLRALRSVEVGSGRQMDLFVGGVAMRLGAADATSVASAILERPGEYIGRLARGGASVGRLRGILQSKTRTPRT